MCIFGWGKIKRLFPQPKIATSGEKWVGQRELNSHIKVFHFYIKKILKSRDCSLYIDVCEPGDNSPALPPPPLPLPPGIQKKNLGAFCDLLLKLTRRHFLMFQQ